MAKKKKLSSSARRKKALAGISSPNDNSSIIPTFPSENEKDVPQTDVVSFHEEPSLCSFSKNEISDMNRALEARLVARSIDNQSCMQCAIKATYFINMNYFCDSCNKFHKTVSEAQEHEMPKLKEMREYYKDKKVKEEEIQWIIRNKSVFNWCLEQTWIDAMDYTEIKKEIIVKEEKK